jgi:hypothetical protein
MSTATTGNDKILEAKSKLTGSLQNFVLSYGQCNNTINCISDLIGKIVSEHSNILNTVNRVLAELHYMPDFFRDKNMQQDYVATVHNFIVTSLKVLDMLSQVTSKHKLPKVELSSSSYVTVQRFVNTYFDNESKSAIKKQFEQKNISVNGFSQKFVMKKKYIKLQLVVGIPLLIICGVIVFAGEAILHRDFNGIQLIFLKAVLSLSISAVGSSILEGNAQYQWTLKKGLTIRAFGWVGIFLLLYFLNPSSPGDVH